MTNPLLHPWPWYVTGPLVGLFPALLLLIGNRLFGVSNNLRHLCAAIAPRRIDYFSYEWRETGSWNLMFTAGILIGGVIAGAIFGNPDPIAIAPATQAALAELGVSEFHGLVPADLFSWTHLFSVRGAALILGGGFLVGFGASYAGGCTSGHGLSGIADLQLPSFIALIGFFVGGILGTLVLLPRIL